MFCIHKCSVSNQDANFSLLPKIFESIALTVKMCFLYRKKNTCYDKEKNVSPVISNKTARNYMENLEQRFCGYLLRYLE